MTFRSKPFSQRFTEMGDLAEGIYEQARPLGKTTRWGWRRPKAVSIRHMPENVRHMPDFYADTGYLVEVMGLGKDGVLKSLKVSKYEALKIWRKIADLLGLGLAVFIWNSHTSQYVMLDWPEIVKLVARAKKRGVEKFENDNNEYYPIDWDWIVELGKPIFWSTDNDS